MPLEETGKRLTPSTPGGTEESLGPLRRHSPGVFYERILAGPTVQDPPPQSL